MVSLVDICGFIVILRAVDAKVEVWGDIQEGVARLACGRHLFNLKGGHHARQLLLFLEAASGGGEHIRNG